jgi:CheY-like chemotaxis protein
MHEAQAVPKEIVILEDNFNIRFTLRHLISHLLKESDYSYKIFSSEDGIQGLGYVLVTTPDLIIIDATLPQYSGKEVLEFLVTNERLMNSDVEVIAMKEGQFDLGLPSSISDLNKTDSNFVDQFVGLLVSTGVVRGSCVEASSYARINKLSSNIIHKALSIDIDRSNIIGSKSVLKATLSLKWILNSVVMNLLLLRMYTISPHMIDDNVGQSRTDMKRYRTRIYPTILVLIVALGFILVQILMILFVGRVFF